MQSVQRSGAGGAAPEPCLVFKAAGFNALIHEGSDGEHRREYKSTANKLLRGKNSDQRGAYV